MDDTRHRILIADDEEGIRFLWRSALLKPVGAYEVLTVSDGHEALEALRRQSFDLVVTDLWMPRLGGVPLTEAIRDLGHQMPVIWLTGRGVPRMEEEAARLGVHRGYHKPLPVDEMRQAVAEALAALQE